MHVRKTISGQGLIMNEEIKKEKEKGKEMKGKERKEKKESMDSGKSKSDFAGADYHYGY